MSAVANTLERLCEANRKITYGVVKPGPEVKGGILFIRGGDVFQGRIAESELRTISPQLSEQYKRTILKGGELLVSLVGTPGEVAVVPDSLAGANIARQVGLVPLGTKVSPHFVMYILRSYQGRSQLFIRTQGAVQQVINLADLKTVEIPDVPLETQIRIASILSAYDDLIENNRRRIQLLEKSARLFYREWFDRLRFTGHEHVKIIDGVPGGWEKSTLGDNIVLNYGKALKADDRIEGKYPVYGSSGIIGTHKKLLVKGPGIIVGRKGNVGSVFWSSKDFHPIDTVYYIDTESSDYYLYNALQNMQFVSSDAAVPGLNRNYAYSRPYLLPPETIRSHFENIVTPIYGQIFKLNDYNEKLKQTRDLLIPHLMNGETKV